MLQSICKRCIIQIHFKKEVLIKTSAFADQTVLVTTTFSPSVDDTRGQLAFKTCRGAVERGFEIIVVDGSPSQEFKAELWNTGARVVDQTEKGMGPSRRQTFSEGLGCGREVIVWLEPEKHSLVPLLDDCIRPVSEEGADIVIPRRRTFQNYPHYQQWSEMTANWLLGDVTGRYDLDFYVGPRIMSLRAARLMASYGTKDGEVMYGDNWEIIFIPILWSMKRRHSIRSVTVDYIHPPEQSTEDTPEMRQKRDRQRVELVGAMSIEAKRLNLTP